MGGTDLPYRSLSSVAERCLPIAEEMHRGGMPWRKVAKELRVSHTALFVWRKLKARGGERGSPEGAVNRERKGAI